MEITFNARLWLYPGGAWHFVTLPPRESGEIRAAKADGAAPGGSIRVCAILGGTRWRTSLFFDRARSAYLLPVKAAVRMREHLAAGDEVEVTLTLDA